MLNERQCCQLFFDELLGSDVSLMVCKINVIETAQVQPPEYDEIRPAEPAISESAMDTLNVVIVDQMRSKFRIFRKNGKICNENI